MLYQLLKFENDANNLVHFSRWSSLQNAKNFFESERLVEIRKQAGVKAPKFVYLGLAEKRGKADSVWIIRSDKPSQMQELGVK